MSPNEVDRALALPAEQVGPAIVAVREDQWFERKSIRVAPKDLAVALVALANAEGGTVVVGVHGGEVEGVKDHTAKVNALRRASLDFTTPPVRARFEQSACTNARGEIDTLLVVRVQPGEVVHELTNGECYLRVGDASRRLGFLERQELHYDRGSAQYDGQAVAGLAVTDLDQDLLRTYRQAAGATSTYTRLLAARGLLTPSGEVTNGAYLLFGAHPQDRFPNAHVRVLRYLSTERGTGARLGLDDSSDFRVEGPIPHVVEEAARTIDRLVPRRRALTPSGTFEGVPIVPKDAWLEGLVNAVIHRSYSLGGDHIRVEIYPNRIEIESPGRFPGLADPTRPLEISRYARNPRIARVCADLRLGQELGEGIKRMFEEMRHLGLADPLYTQTQGSVRLTLTAVSRLAPDVEARLPRGALNVLDALRRAGQPLGTGDVQDLLGLSRPTVTKHLNALRNEGLVQWDGRSPKDPRAVWTITEG